MANTQTTVPLFVANTVLTAASQNISAGTGVPVFATTVTRDAAFGGSNKALAEGQLCYLESTNVMQYYDGTAFVSVSALSLLDVTTFSASSAVNVSNKLVVANNANYLIIVNYAGSANNILNMRFRENVTDKATGYSRGTSSVNMTAGTIAATGGVAQTTMRIAVFETSQLTTTINLNLLNSGTIGNITFTNNDYSNASADSGGAFNTSCTAITGFSLLPSAGTITGTVRTYGYALS